MLAAEDSTSDEGFDDTPKPVVAATGPDSAPCIDVSDDRGVFAREWGGDSRLVNTITHALGRDDSPGD